MNGKILVIPPEQNTAEIYTVDQEGFLAVIATIKENATEEENHPIEIKYRLKVNVPKLNVRSGPGLYYPDVGDLFEGNIVEVLEISGSDAWVRIGEGIWTACQIKTTKYLIQDIDIS